MSGKLASSHERGTRECTEIKVLADEKEKCNNSGMKTQGLTMSESEWSAVVRADGISLMLLTVNKVFL